MLSQIPYSERRLIAEAYEKVVSEALFDERKSDTYEILAEFKDDISRGIRRKTWNLIPAKQYQYAIRKFSESEPETFVFSERLINDWLDIIITNTQQIDAISNLTGRNELNGLPDIDSYAVEELFPDEFSASVDKLLKKGFDRSRIRENAAYDVLENEGFYDWALLPDGNTADSDNGVSGVEEILDSVDYDSSISDKLVAINRCLDVFHRRSDWASAFIEGGKNTLYKVSNGIDV